MNIEKVVLARKWTGLEWGALKQGKSLKDAIEDESHLGMDTDIVRGHYRQVRALDYFMDRYSKALGDPKLLVGDDLCKESFVGADLAIVLSGDNYYQHVSHFIDDQMTLGVNNDPEKSTGAFAYFNVVTFANILQRLLTGEFNIAEWLRLQARVDGGSVLPILGISEVSVATLDPCDMNRYEIESPAGTEVHKGTGLLVATAHGMGKHSWTRNESQYLLNRPEYDLSVGSKEAIFITRAANLEDYHMLSGKIGVREKIGVTWLAHGEGGIKIDPKHGDPFLAIFGRGAKIEVEIADKPFRVVLPN